MYVAAIFYAVYSTLCIFVPTWAPSVHLQVQSTGCHTLSVLRRRHFAVLTGYAKCAPNISLERVL